MKNIKSFAGACLALVLVFGLVACSKPEDSGNEAEASKKEPFLFKNEEENFSLDIPGRFELVETEKLTDGLKGNIYRFVNADESLEISDIEFPGVEVNEALIEEEMEMGSGLEITRMDNIDLPGQGKFYGALVHDTSLGRYVFYHRIAKGDRIISFLQSRAVPYSLDEEAEHKAMLGTLKFS